jgi:hypothetical protein
MTTWTAPKTWTATQVSVSDMNTHVRDNLNHLKESIPPGSAGSADIAGVGGAGTSEEWGTTTTGLTWTPSNPTTVDSHTTILDHLYIDNPADTTTRLGTKSWAPGAGAFDARLGGIWIGSSTHVASVGAQMGLHIGDSGNSNRLLLDISFNPSTQVQTVVSYTYAASTYTQRGTTKTVPFVPMYARITRDGSNNVSFFWSANGVLWNFIATQSFTLTIANIGVYIAASTSNGFQCAADWLRTSV